MSGNDYGEIYKIFNFVEQEGGPIFMLINCAGISFCGKLEDISPSDIRVLLYSYLIFLMTSNIL